MVILAVPGRASARPTVRAPWVAGGVGMAPAHAVPAAVYQPERRTRHGEEHNWVLCHPLRDRLATGDACADELEHVGGVEPRAGGAHVLATVPAADMRDTERLGVASVGRDHLARRRIQGGRLPSQPNRPLTVTDSSQRLRPSVELPRADQIPDLAPRPARRRQQVEPRWLATLGPHLLRQRGQRVVHNAACPGAHRPHHPRGRAARPIAVPPRDTPGPGGSRSPTG